MAIPRMERSRPGTDHALDLKAYKKITKEGEPEY